MKNPSNFEKKHHFFKQLFLQNLFGKMVFLKMEGFAWQIIYTYHSEAKTDCQKKNSLRDIAVIELLFATGMRISVLCSLKINDVNLYDRSILIYGKGSKERKVQIGTDVVIHALEEYKAALSKWQPNYFVKN